MFKFILCSVAIRQQQVSPPPIQPLKFNSLSVPLKFNSLSVYNFIF